MDSNKSNKKIEIIPVFDAHTHVFPDKIADKSKQSVSDFYGLPMFTSGTEAELKKVRDNGRNGYKIVGQLICSPSTNPAQTRSINGFIHSVIERNPDCVGFGTLHPKNEDYTEIISEIKSMGLKGVKFHSDFQQFNLDDKMMYPIYREIAKQGLPILFHMGDEKYDFSSPKRLKKVLQDIPELTVIAAHLGGYSHWSESIALPSSPRLFFDISSSLAFVDKKLIEKFIARFGETQFFFGSDFPMWNPYDELKRLEKMDFDESLMRKLLYDNFMNFISKY